MKPRIVVINLVISTSLVVCDSNANVSKSQQGEHQLANSGQTEIINIGSRRELFVDYFLIEKLEGVHLKLHEPKLTPLVPGTPSGHYATIIKDGNIYRRYERIGTQKHPTDPPEMTGYWESRDGIHWEKPDLGIFEVNGSRHNNVILANEKWVVHNFTPFLDTRRGVPKDQRFKALAGRYEGGGLFAFVSADGIHWRKLRDKPVIPAKSSKSAKHWWDYFAFDSQNVSFWSESEGCYVCYFRTWKTPQGRLRTISRTTSKDFVHWSAPVAMNPNLPGEHLYTSGTHPYFRAKHIYIALPTQILPERGNLTHILFMTSRGGNKYDRTFREAFIRPGLDPSKWTDRANFVALNVVPTSPTEMSIYVRERRYVLRLDGFVSVHAGYDRGELITKLITFSGRKLEINYSTSAAGDIRVEIQDYTGKPIPGYTLDDCLDIIGDEIQHFVKWKSGSDVSSLAGKPIRLRFVMRDADLYSFRFVNQ